MSEISKVAITYNHKSQEIINQKGAFDDATLEWDDDETISAVKSAIEKKFETVLINADINCFEKLKNEKPDFVFNMAEGIHGPNREAHIPAVLEMLNIPYSGSDVGTLVNALDKGKMKEILGYYNIANPRYLLIENEDNIDLQLQSIIENKQYIVKPACEGSSKGVKNNSIANTKNEIKFLVLELIKKYNQPVLIEEFLTGREFTVAILGNSPDIIVLPIVEINFDDFPENANKIYSYEAKWIWDTVEKPLRVFDCPANLDDNLKNKISDIAVAAYSALRCRDWCRIDIRLDNKDIPNIIELNPLPGILPNPDNNSCFPKAARAFGLEYDALINKVIDIACKRNNVILQSKSYEYSACI